MRKADFKQMSNFHSVICGYAVNFINDKLNRMENCSAVVCGAVMGDAGL